MGAKIFEILTYFIIYSFLGWIMESIVRSVSEKKIINTGFLKGPVCPIYGIGAIIMLLFLERYQNKPILLFYSHYSTNYMGVLSGSFIRKNISYKILGLF